jgi:site-specific recombinase XerD
MYVAKQANTLRKYKVTYKKLCKYFGDKPFYFESFNLSFLHEYESVLKSDGLSTNTVSKEMAVLKAVLFRAIREGYCQLEKNPFFNYKLRFTKSTKEKLDIDEIRRIEKLEFPKTNQLFHVKNVWLFSLYNGGVRFGDLCRLKWTNIIDNRLVYTMNKTSITKSFQLFPQAQEILNSYKSDNPDNYIFPLLNNNILYDEFTVLRAITSQNAIYNKYLKTIARLAGINKNLSMHVSRHSFADIARKKGLGVYTISKALGHSSLKETETYLQCLDQSSVDESISTIFDRPA